MSIKKKSFNYCIEGFKGKTAKETNIDIALLRDERGYYLGPLINFKKEGKGIRFIKERKIFIEGNYEKDKV